MQIKNVTPIEKSQLAAIYGGQKRFEELRVPPKKKKK